MGQGRPQRGRQVCAFQFLIACQQFPQQVLFLHVCGGDIFQVIRSREEKKKHLKVSVKFSGGGPDRGITALKENLQPQVS